MKKFIRLLIKLPATPFVVAFFVFSYVIFSVFAFFQWVYDASDFDRSITFECRDDMAKHLKKWFTTI
jgi:hypothetical protein